MEVQRLLESAKAESAAAKSAADAASHRAQESDHRASAANDRCDALTAKLAAIGKEADLLRETVSKANAETEGIKKQLDDEKLARVSKLVSSALGVWSITLTPLFLF